MYVEFTRLVGLPLEDNRTAVNELFDTFTFTLLRPPTPRFVLSQDFALTFFSFRHLAGDG